MCYLPFLTLNDLMLPMVIVLLAVNLSLSNG